jgi:antitoxin CptB
LRTRDKEIQAQNPPMPPPHAPRMTRDDRRAAPCGDRELARLRWRCRRGMLENDLILARFLDARGAALSGDEASALSRLLDLPDGELWALLSGRAEPEDPALRRLVAGVRRT